MDSMSESALCEPPNFADVIGIVFNNWTALKLSVEHGMAGSPAVVARKLQSMVEQVSLILASGNAEWDVMSDYLIDTMDSDFATILEDESSVEVAVHICELHRMFRAGNFQDLTSNIKLMPNQMPINASPVHRVQSQEVCQKKDKEAIIKQIKEYCTIYQQAILIIKATTVEVEHWLDKQRVATVAMASEYVIAMGVQQAESLDLLTQKRRPHAQD